VKPLAELEGPSVIRSKYEIELFLLSEPFRLFEDDRDLGMCMPRGSSVEVSFGKLIFSCWNENWSRSWRVLECESSSEVLRLRCSKQMGRTSCLLELVRDAGDQVAVRSRREFLPRLRSLIESAMQGFTVASAKLGRPDRRLERGVHLRLILKKGRSTFAGLAVWDGETQPILDSVLAGGLVWLDELRKKADAVKQLLLFVPRGRSATIATRICALRNPASVSLFEYDQKHRAIEPVAAFDQGDLMDRLKKISTRAVWPRERRIDSDVQQMANRIVLMAPNEIEKNRRGNFVSLSVRGLEFARVSITRKRIEFGLGEKKTGLTDENVVELRRLIDQIVSHRLSDPSDRGDLFFRAQAERWLESCLLSNINLIDPTFDSRYVYSQVPAYRGDQRSYIDVLTATRGGRLAVLELKVSEDPDFPLQGLDYWLRVEWHRRRGDFQKRGYFKGAVLTGEPPLLYLVAPLFRFHATTKLICEQITSEIPVYRIGINEDWRREVRVLLNERVN